MKFEWGAGSVFGKLSAQKIGERLQKLGEGVTAKEVVKDARDERSPLHPCFEWDNTVAGEKHREWQARQLLSHIRVVEVGSKEPKRVYVNVTTTTRREYVPVTKALSDAELYRQVLDRAQADLEAFESRYAEFAALKQIARDAQKRVAALKSTAKRKAAA